jgi:hypothetical protein
MMDSKIWYTPDKNIWKKDLLVVDLILFLVSKLKIYIKIYNIAFYGKRKNMGFL